MRTEELKRRAGVMAAALVTVSLGAPASVAYAQNTTAPNATSRTQVSTSAGEWTWGISVPILRLGVLRRPDEPGFRRNYEVDLQWITPQLAFQVTLRPKARPWRIIDVNDHTEFQSISVSGLLLVGLDTQQARKSEVALGLSVNFLNGILGVGFAFDLYRGIPVLGGTGTSGGDVAPTGLLAAAFTRDGEVTVENVSFLLHLNLVAIGQMVGR
jgi:hypothetical protein